MPVPMVRLVCHTSLGHKLPSTGYTEAGARRMIERAHPSVVRVDLIRADGSIVKFERRDGVLVEVP